MERKKARGWFFIRLYYKRFKQKKERTKYLLIDTEYRRRDLWDGHYACREFSTLKEVNQYLVNDVAKSERKDWKLYKAVEAKS